MELEEVKLKAEIAKTAAREKILAEAEAEYDEGTSSILSELTEEMLKNIHLKLWNIYRKANRHM